MDQISPMTLTFRCVPELDKILPRPIPAMLSLPDWFKAMRQKEFNAITGKDEQTVKRCPPFIDAMTYGFLIPLAIDLEVRNGEFSWEFDGPWDFVTEFPQSPIDFHDPSQVVGTPLFDGDRFVIKFNNFWTIEAPPAIRCCSATRPTAPICRSPRWPGWSMPIGSTSSPSISRRAGTIRTSTESYPKGP